MKSLATSMEPLNIFNVCIAITPYTFRPRLWCYNCLFLFYQPIIFSYGSIYIIIIMIIVLFFYWSLFFLRLHSPSSHDYAHKICSFVVKQIAGNGNRWRFVGPTIVLCTYTHSSTYIQHWNYKSSWLSLCYMY